MTSPAPATTGQQIAAVHYFARRVTAAIARHPNALTGADEDLLQAYSLLCGAAEYSEDRADRDEEHAQGLHLAGPVHRCPSCEQDQADADEDEAHALHAAHLAAASAA